MCNAESYGERKSGCCREIELIAIMKSERVQGLSFVEVWIEIDVMSIHLHDFAQCTQQNGGTVLNVLKHGAQQVA